MSPRLAEHLGRCPSCTEWENERARWGELGALFREEAPVTDLMSLRNRVRLALAERSAPRFAWLRPLAAAASTAMALSLGLYASKSLLTMSDGGHYDPRPVADRGVSLLPHGDAAGTASGAMQDVEAGAGAGLDDRQLSGGAGLTPGGARTTWADALQTAENTTVNVHREDTGPASGGVREQFRIVRVGDDLGIEWKGNGERLHKVVKGDDPADFSGSMASVVRGDRWVDSSPDIGQAAIQYYLID